MTEKSNTLLRRAGRQFWAKLSIGIITIVPFAASAWILYWIFISIDNILQPVIKVIWGRTIPGAGFAATLVLILLVGFIAGNVIGKRLIQYAESVIPGMPLFHQLYSGIKQIMESFSPAAGTSRMHPVLIDFPRKGMKALGFITSELRDESGKKLFFVFIPNSPNPTSGGFMEVVEETEITRTDISIESAFRTIFTAGKVVPEEVSRALFTDSKPPTDN
ncbi:MAG: DUF502 domain-containing protein [Chloroflexi bacterium]|nr:DUF502 domain-containing protein [Chloroflexota bacterium]